ncbi:MAG: hypothetical protein ABJD68_15840 [Nakamurella sp.]
MGHFEGRLAEVELAAARTDPPHCGLAQLALIADRPAATTPGQMIFTTVLAVGTGEALRGITPSPTDQ